MAFDHYEQAAVAEADRHRKALTACEERSTEKQQCLESRFTHTQQELSEARDQMRLESKSCADARSSLRILQTESLANLAECHANHTAAQSAHELRIATMAECARLECALRLLKQNLASHR